MKSARNTLPDRTAPTASPAESTGPVTITRCRSSITAAAKSCGPRSSTTPPDCASCSSCSSAPACGEVAIERPDGPVVDTLLDAGVTVVVISPNQVKNLRGRYGSAGNKDDRFDAFVLADTLRTDRARLRPLLPDSPATVTLRQTCRARKDLVAHRVAVANQLRAHLQIVFPGAVGSVRRPRLARSAWRSWPASTAKTAPTGSRPNAWPPGWPASATAAAPTPPCCTPGSPPHHAAPPATDGTASHVTRAFVAVLTSLVAQIKALSTPDRRTTRPPRRRAHLHQPAPLRHASAPPGCSPRSATAAPASPPPNRWPAWPASPPPPANPARSSTSASAGPATNNSATPSPTSPATAATPTPGPPTSTTAPAPAATTTPTPSASWPAPGSTSSGTAGKTTPPTTPTNTAPSNAPQPRSTPAA